MNKFKVANMAPLIAVIGCDGSGKSTVSEQILGAVKECAPAATAHLGKQQGNLARSLAQLPLIGSLIERVIERKVKKVHSSNAKNKAPSVLAALVMYLFVLKRVRRFRHMLALRQQGLIVIADRFPQLAIPSAYDGPDLSAKAEGNFFVRWLAKREQVAFEWMTNYQPDLVIRLNVDLDTACARKPDHPRDLLKQKLEVTPLLTYKNAPIIDIDTQKPLKEVVAQAKQAVNQCLTQLGYQSLRSERVHA